MTSYLKLFPRSSYLLLILGLLMLCGGALSAPAQISLACTPPTTRADGTALTAAELAGYKFYSANSVRDYVTPVQPTCAYSYIVEVGKCIEATDTWAVSAVDTAGLESALSTPVAIGQKVCTPKPKPGAPGNVRITITPAS